MHNCALSVHVSQIVPKEEVSLSYYTAHSLCENLSQVRTNSPSPQDVLSVVRPHHIQLSHAAPRFAVPHRRLVALYPLVFHLVSSRALPCHGAAISCVSSLVSIVHVTPGRSCLRSTYPSYYKVFAVCLVSVRTSFVLVLLWWAVVESRPRVWALPPWCA